VAERVQRAKKADDGALCCPGNAAIKSRDGTVPRWLLPVAVHHRCLATKNRCGSWVYIKKRRKKNECFISVYMRGEREGERKQ
jgi:hypothetical protein